MSFSYETKNELCRLPVQKLCCARAEAYGILLYCNTFHASEVRIVTENPNFAARLPRLFQRAFNLRFDRLPEPDQPGKADLPDHRAKQDGPHYQSVGIRSPGSTRSCISTSECWRRSAAGLPFCGGRFLPAAASPIPPSATIWS